MSLVSAETSLFAHADFQAPVLQCLKFFHMLIRCSVENNISVIKVTIACEGQCGSLDICAGHNSM